jgi:hypothetical protein
MICEIALYHTDFLISVKLSDFYVLITKLLPEIFYYLSISLENYICNAKVNNENVEQLIEFGLESGKQATID